MTLASPAAEPREHRHEGLRLPDPNHLQGGRRQNVPGLQDLRCSLRPGVSSSRRYGQAQGVKLLMRMSIVDGIIIAQFPVENHSEQGQFAEMSLKTIGESDKMGDYYAIRSIGEVDVRE